MKPAFWSHIWKRREWKEGVPDVPQVYPHDLFIFFMNSS
jgi:hypothetical protein